MKNRSLFSVCFVMLVMFLMGGRLLAVQAQTDNFQPNRIRSIAWKPDGTQLAFGYHNGLVQVVDRETRAVIFEFETGEWPILSLAWHPHDPVLAGVSYDGRAWSWDVAAGKRLHTFSAPQYGLGVIWSRDGSQLITGSIEGKTFRVWDASSGELLVERERIGSIGQMAWSPDGTLLAIVNPVGIVILLSAATFDVIAKFEVTEELGHGGDLYSIAWHPGGAALATGGLNGKVRVWIVKTGEILAEFKANEYPLLGYYRTTVHSVHYSPDGRYLTAVSADGTIRTWDVVLGKVVWDVQMESHISAAAWSRWGGQLAYAETDLFAQEPDHGVRVIVPYPTNDMLRSLIDQCVQDRSALRRLSDTIKLRQLFDFMDTIGKMPEAEIRLGCAADLVAVAEALFDE